MEIAAVLMMTGPMIGAIVVAANAKKINAQWRERRARRTAGQATG